MSGACTSVPCIPFKFSVRFPKENLVVCMHEKQVVLKVITVPFKRLESKLCPCFSLSFGWCYGDLTCSTRAEVPWNISFDKADARGSTMCSSTYIPNWNVYCSILLGLTSWSQQAQGRKYLARHPMQLSMPIRLRKKCPVLKPHWYIAWLSLKQVCYQVVEERGKSLSLCSTPAGAAII